jgi:hypothetical protein
MTKNDLYAILIREGVNRHYEVIPEFCLYPQSKSKIDLVWATRRHPGTWQDRDNHAFWDLKAVFEIEGCNVRRATKELLRHVGNFAQVQDLYGPADVPRFVVLYTAAYDRHFTNAAEHRGLEVATRIGWAENLGIQILDGRNIEDEIAVRFPRI